MEGKMTGKALKGALGTELEALLEEVAQTMNQARPGKIIADSEEGVRDATGEFRRRLYEKALELRQKQDGAFSPSGGVGEVAQQGPAPHQLPDGQRASGVPQDDLLESRPRKRRSR